jgi:hypothetical protein
MFMPGIVPIWFLFAEFFPGRGLLRLTTLRRRFAGMFIPGIVPMSCFLAGFILRAALLCFGGAFRLALGLDFGIFMPGMFCMS